MSPFLCRSTVPRPFSILLQTPTPCGDALRGNENTRRPNFPLSSLAGAPKEGVQPPSCNRTCGEVEIPYPFGVGDGSYAEEYRNPFFNVSCNYSADPPRPFIRDANNPEQIRHGSPGECRRAAGRQNREQRVRDGEGGVVTGGGRIEAEEGGVVDLEVEGDDEEETDEDEDEEEDEEVEGEEEEEDGDIQVVPWSTEAAAAVASPPPMASCSSSDESSSTRMAIGRGFIRRVRENANASASQDDLELGYSPSRSGYLGPSPPSTTVVACSGCAHEAETNSVGHQKSPLHQPTSS